MSVRTSVGVSVVLCLALCSPQAVHARFGKASSSGGGRSSASRATISVHSGHTFSGSTRFGSSPAPRPSARVWVPRSSYVAPAYVVPTYYGYSTPGYVPGGEFEPPRTSDAPSEPPPYPEAPLRLHAALQGDAGLAGDSALLGARGLIEGRQIGLSLGYTGVLSPATDGSATTDVFHLAAAHLTLSLLNSARGRIRAEFGAHVAVAPDATFVAPGIGMSADLRLLGAWGLETRILGNVWPYSQLDGRLGLTYGNRWITLSGGVRALYLNDNGALGAANAGDTSDFFVGPYVGLGFSS